MSSNPHPCLHHESMTRAGHGAAVRRLAKSCPTAGVNRQSFYVPMHGMDVMQVPCRTAVSARWITLNSVKRGCWAAAPKWPAYLPTGAPGEQDAALKAAFLHSHPRAGRASACSCRPCRPAAPGWLTNGPPPVHQEGKTQPSLLRSQPLKAGFLP